MACVTEGRSQLLSLSLPRRISDVGVLEITLDSSYSSLFTRGKFDAESFEKCNHAVWRRKVGNVTPLQVFYYIVVHFITRYENKSFCLRLQLRPKILYFWSRTPEYDQLFTGPKSSLEKKFYEGRKAQP